MVAATSGAYTVRMSQSRQSGHTMSSSHTSLAMRLSMCLATRLVSSAAVRHHQPLQRRFVVGAQRRQLLAFGPVKELALALHMAQVGGAEALHDGRRLARASPLASCASGSCDAN